MMVATKDVADCVGCGEPVVFDYGQTKKNNGLIYCPGCDLCFSLQQSILAKQGIINLEDEFTEALGELITLSQNEPTLQGGLEI